MAELVIRYLEQSCEPVNTPHVLARYLHAGLVAGIMIDGRPCVLKGRAQLQFKTIVVSGQTADIMQRVIAETVQLMQLAFIHGVHPVYLKELLCHGGNTVHIVGIERDNTRSQDIGDVTKRSVLGTFERQLARQTLFSLNTRLDGRHNESVALQSLPQDTRHFDLHLFKHRSGLAVLL